MIAEEWDSYLRKVLPHLASEYQIRECKRAFYAGATALFSGLMRGVSYGFGHEQRDIAMLQSVNAELSSFIDSEEA